MKAGKAPFGVRPDTEARTCYEDFANPAEFLKAATAGVSGELLRMVDKSASELEAIPGQYDIMSTLKPSKVEAVSTEKAVDALTQTLIDRGSRYGQFTGHAEATQALKAIVKSKMGTKWDLLGADQKEAIEMICHKLGRIINGDPDYADSWVDIAGYAKLVSDRLEGVIR